MWFRWLVGGKYLRFQVAVLSRCRSYCLVWAQSCFRAYESVGAVCHNRMPSIVLDPYA